MVPLDLNPLVHFHHIPYKSPRVISCFCKANVAIFTGNKASTLNVINLKYVLVKYKYNCIYLFGDYFCSSKNVVKIFFVINKKNAASSKLY